MQDGSPTIECFGTTDRGKVREVNEDQFLIAELSKSMLIQQTSLTIEDETRKFGSSQGTLLLVADGMGGHAAGDRASAVAVETLMRYVLNFMPWFLGLDAEHEDDLFDELKSAVVKCQEKIDAAAAAQPDRAGMGTTLTMAYLYWPRAYVVHVGDSRCYLRRGDELEQITRDHTVAQKLVEEGKLEPEEAETSRYSSILWNALGGTTADVSSEVYKTKLEPGDTVLLCTDGLTKHVEDTKLLKFLTMQKDAEEICRGLVDAANDAGGTDNITTVLARFRV